MFNGSNAIIPPTARIAPKICQGQPQTMYSECSTFYRNRFTFGGAIGLPERVNTVKTRRRLNEIYGWSLASSQKHKQLHWEIIITNSLDLLSLSCAMLVERYYIVFCRRELAAANTAGFFMLYSRLDFSVSECSVKGLTLVLHVPVMNVRVS